MEKYPQHFYITTPIYYVNDKPHIGHAYTTILADILARYYRLLEVPSFFLTGTDEHGQKVEQAASRNGIIPIEQCDSTVIRFKELWHKLEITNDDFIRTTEGRHKVIVQGILQDLYDREEIYKSEYEGWYCIPCERFFTEKDLIEGSCPECHRAVEKIVEMNYFFRMSKHQQWLIDYINHHPDFIQPPHRRNETLGFLRKPLGDLCISRPKSRLSWGIELPFDSDYVCYVWFDALINYISAIDYKSDPSKFNKWWPASYHLIGKDILTTHTVYWPIMLKAIGVDLPESIFAHGWWLMGRDKMGKSLGNVVDPMEMCDKYGVDPFRYYLVAEMTPGQDANFTEESFIDRYNNDLADGLGNMLNRVVKLIHRHYDGYMPKPDIMTEIDNKLKLDSLNAIEAMEKAIHTMKLDRGIARMTECVRKCNRYFEETAPWKLVKDGKLDRLSTILNTAAEVLRIISGLLYPVMPSKMGEMRKVLGLPNNQIEPKLHDLREWGNWDSMTKVCDITSLFPRIELGRERSAAGNQITKKFQNDVKDTKLRKLKDVPPARSEENVMGVVDFVDFGKIELKTAKVLVAEKVQGTDRLLRLVIDIGQEHRQIVAGIAEYYQPEQLLGVVIVVVANLKSATIRGLQSDGMLLAARKGKKLKIITVDGDFAPGASVG